MHVSAFECRNFSFHCALYCKSYSNVVGSHSLTGSFNYNNVSLFVIFGKFETYYVYIAFFQFNFEWNARSYKCADLRSSVLLFSLCDVNGA